jgi:hypothetical protein
MEAKYVTRKSLMGPSRAGKRASGRSAVFRGRLTRGDIDRWCTTPVA